MRTYIKNKNTSLWEVVTDRERCIISSLVHALQLGLNESPFYANYGIPAQSAVVNQIPPDVYVSLLVKKYRKYFAKLNVIKIDEEKAHYTISLTTLTKKKYDFTTNTNF